VEVVLLKNIQELKVLHTNNIELTLELHILQAHLLHYQELLHSFKVSVEFIAKTHNPAMDSGDDFSYVKESEELMKSESDNLLGEIDRLERRRAMLSSRLHSSETRKLTEATVRDSATMKQVIPLCETEVT
jgi:hypothetical protein